jgi:glutamine amidotransferase
MSDLLLRSSQSLIRQSYHARERAEPLNGDGFGVGWYSLDIDPTPGLFTSVQPAWGNRNLARLAPKISSTCFFAHVRAASQGSPITELNCHPFQYRRLLWMHNGRIANFKRVKRHLQARLSDQFYDAVLGTTDSEHAFALFLERLGGDAESYSLQTLEAALLAMIRELDDLTSSTAEAEPSHYNFAVTDGRNLLATRYVSGSGAEPETLYLSKGKQLEVRGGQFRMLTDDSGTVEAVIVASEPLTDAREDWLAVPRNHLVSISSDFEVRVAPI